MKKIFILEDLDCAHCAGKIEADVKETAGVLSASLKQDIAYRLVYNIAACKHIGKQKCGKHHKIFYMEEVAPLLLILRL